MPVTYCHNSISLLLFLLFYDYVSLCLNFFYFLVDFLKFYGIIKKKGEYYGVRTEVKRWKWWEEGAF